MKLQVFVKIGRKQGLLGWDGQQLTVGVDAPPIDGAANSRLVEILSEWLNVSKNKIQIIKGYTSRYKTLEIEIDQNDFKNLVNNIPRILRQGLLLPEDN